MSPLTLLLSLSYLNGFGQANPTFDQHPIPPSPEAQAFMKYGTYPVDYSTGVPKIEIPIYQIKSGSLSLPVSLNYHASGIKMNELASSSGLGWSLNAGGMVSRVINQVEDEREFLSTDHYSSDDIHNSQQSPANGYPLVYSYVKAIAFGNHDGRSDDYYYNVGNGLSGQFVYDINKIMHQRSFTNNIITRTAQNTFQITGEDGTRYTFNDLEKTNSPISGFCPSSWMISSIISANLKDTISFEYNYFPGYSYSVESQTYNNNNPDLNNTFPSNQKFEKHYSTMIYDASVLVKRIKFKGGTITFSYESGRKDVMNNRLSAVTINNLSNSGTEIPLKTYQLIHTYFLSNPTNPNTFEAKLRLDEIKLFDQNNTYVNSYHFYYNSGIMPPMINQNNPSSQPGGYACGGCAIDFWGYYNGHAENTTLLPLLPSEVFGSAANRSADINYMKAESLEKIDFPTGGSTTFEFEANSATTMPVVGGLRIKKITSTAGPNSLPIVKQYTYNSNNLLTINADQGWFSFNQYLDEGGTTYANMVTDYYFKTVYFSEPTIPNGSYNGCPVLYSSVTESMDDGNGQKQQTTYNYEFDNDRAYNIPETSKYGSVAYSDKSWARGNLISTSYYKYNGTNFILNKKTINHYDTYKSGTVNTGLNCFIQVLHTTNPAYPGDPLAGDIKPYPYGVVFPMPDRFDFNFFDVYEEVGIRKLTGTEEIDYDNYGNPTTNKVTNMSYESTEHLFPTKEIQTNSDGNQWISLYKYPFDFRGQTPYDDMITNNLVSPTIQVLNYKNSTAQFISSQKTNYANWGNGVIAPASIDIQKTSGPIERSLNIKYNAQANLAQIQKYSGPFTSYQWGYNNLYPVAECKNADNDEFFTENFEDAAGATQGIGHTGEKYFVGNYTTANKISPGYHGKTYVISYWYISTGLWQFSGEIPYTGQQLSGTLDDIRIYPSNASITTYTYKPLVGMTSMTDSRANTTYYEYDNLQRLKNVKDASSSILKNYQYHYKQ